MHELICIKCNVHFFGCQMHQTDTIKQKLQRWTNPREPQSLTTITTKLKDVLRNFWTDIWISSHVVLSYITMECCLLCQVMSHSLHWLPISARIKFKTLVLAYKAVNGHADETIIQDHYSPTLTNHHSTRFSVLTPKCWPQLLLYQRTAEFE